MNSWNLRTKGGLADVSRIAAVLLVCTPALAGPPIPPAPIPPPTGSVINVSTVPQLQGAVAALSSNRTILIAPGTYNLTGTLYVNGSFSNVGIRGATGNRDDVVLVGKGMNAASDGGVPFGIWVGGNVQGITIANLTIRDVYNHPILLNAGAHSPFIHNVRLVDAGQQFIKSNPNGAGGGVENGIVEYSILEYSTTSRDSYTNGVDVHTGTNWIIRHNLFKNLRAPQGQLAGPAILMWNASSGSIAEGNAFINCQREISFGLIDHATTDHSGGIIRNNFVYRSSGVAGDAAILVADSPGTQVLHNSIFVSGTYSSPIEYRFPGTTGTLIANNLLDGVIQARDGASGTATGNVTTATAALFVSPAAGDLHLKPTAATAIDRVPTLLGSPKDWDGESRPSGAAADAGADEFRPTSVTPLAPPTNLRIIG